MTVEICFRDARANFGNYSTIFDKNPGFTKLLNDLNGGP